MSRNCRAHGAHVGARPQRPADDDGSCRRPRRHGSKVSMNAMRHRLELNLASSSRLASAHWDNTSAFLIFDYSRAEVYSDPFAVYHKFSFIPSNSIHRNCHTTQSMYPSLQLPCYPTLLDGSDPRPSRCPCCQVRRLHFPSHLLHIFQPLHPQAVAHTAAFHGRKW